MHSDALPANGESVAAHILGTSCDRGKYTMEKMGKLWGRAFVAGTASEQRRRAVVFRGRLRRGIHTATPPHSRIHGKRVVSSDHVPGIRPAKRRPALHWSRERRRLQLGKLVSFLRHISYLLPRNLFGYSAVVNMAVLKWDELRLAHFSPSATLAILLGAFVSLIFMTMHISGYKLIADSLPYIFAQLQYTDCISTLLQDIQDLFWQG